MPGYTARTPQGSRAVCYHGRVTTAPSLLADLTEPDAPAWDYIAGFEAPEAYDAFAYYRDLGPRSRTLSGTARALGLGPGTVATWARRGMWAERAASYDQHRACERETLRKVAEADVDQKWADKRAERLEQLNEIADLGASQLVHRLRNRRGELRPNELVQVARLLLHFGNLANGDATEKVAGLPDYSMLSDEQLRAQREAVELLRKTLGSKNDE